MAVPSDLSGLQLWLKSDTGLWQDTAGTTAATANGDPIGRWDDQSGNGRNATQSTSGARPTLSTATQYGGINSVEFTAATGQWFDLPNFLSGFTAGEVFAVTKLRNNQPTVPQRTAYWRLGNEAAGGNTNSHIRWTDGLTYERFGTTVRKEAITVSERLGTWFWYNVWSASNDYAVNVNGTNYYTTATNTVGFTTTPMLGRLASDATYFFDGYWEELFLFDRKLSSGERQDMLDYLAARYGEPDAQVSRVAGNIVEAGSDARVSRVAGTVVEEGATARVSRVAGNVVEAGGAARVSRITGNVVEAGGEAEVSLVAGVVVRTRVPSFAAVSGIQGVVVEKGGSAQVGAVRAIVVRTRQPTRRRGAIWHIG